jgi:peroxiredoxin
VTSTIHESGPQVGAPAPDFTLPSTAGGTVTLSALRGETNVLLAFFPLAFTSVCQSELCAFGEDLSKFNDAQTRVFGISTDFLPSQKAFRAQAGFATELLSDAQREAARAYGVLIADKGFTQRAYFLIDREGILRWKWIEAELGHRRENAELLAEIQKLSA